MTIGIAMLQVLCQGARLFVHRGVEGTESRAARCMVRWMAEWLRAGGWQNLHVVASPVARGGQVCSLVTLHNLSWELLEDPQGSAGEGMEGRV